MQMVPKYWRRVLIVLCCALPTGLMLAMGWIAFQRDQLDGLWAATPFLATLLSAAGLAGMLFDPQRRLWPALLVGAAVVCQTGLGFLVNMLVAVLAALVIMVTPARFVGSGDPI